MQYLLLIINNEGVYILTEGSVLYNNSTLGGKTITVPKKSKVTINLTEFKVQYFH